MNLTYEQEDIINAVLAKNPDGTQKHELIKVNACAGSGKTSVLVEIAKHARSTNGIYLAYNKAIAC